MSSKRLSRDHHDTGGLTTYLAPREIPPRDIVAEVFNSWLASTYALTPSATITDLMKSCTDYVEATGVDKDSLGGLLDFDKTRGFKKRMTAANIKDGPRIIATGKFWTIKNIFSVSPESKRWQQPLHKATVAKLYDDRKKLLKVRNHSCIKFKL